MPQFFGYETPAVENAANGFTNFLQNIATQSGVNFSPAPTATGSLQNFLSALAVREQQTAPVAQSSPVAQTAPAAAAPPMSVQVPQTAPQIQTFNPVVYRNQPVYNDMQLNAPPAPPAQKSAFGFWGSVLLAALMLTGKG